MFIKKRKATLPPTLQTERLLLRRFLMEDCRDVTRMVGDPEIAANTLNIPYPYEYNMAAEWIKSHQKLFTSGKGVVFAVTALQQGYLIGATGININTENKKAELGYWIGKEFWRNGYAVEAGQAVLDYGFNRLGLNRIFAKHLGSNLASGKVMQKLGMKYEGCLRQDVEKNGELEDLVIYGILKTEYENHGESG